MKFELTRQFIDELKAEIKSNNASAAIDMLKGLYPADIADILDELDTDEARFVFFQMDPLLASEILVELEEDDQEHFLKNIPGRIIASELIDKMDSDDATDVLQNLPDKLKDEVLQHIADSEMAGDIADLLNYDEDTAGGLMAKELLKVNINWDINTCLSEFRHNAELVGQVYYLYVVDDTNILRGVLPIKKLLIYHGKVKVADVLDKEVIYVKVDATSQEVAHIMDKYDLVVLPVVDSIGRLSGKITIDDVVDVIREERERDYQMLAGISEDIESSDSVFLQTRARLPWLLIGMVGGIFGAQIIGTHSQDLQLYAGLALFLPMIGGMAGNVGVQASSIIVQSLATEVVDIESPVRKLLKEFLVGLINGAICSSVIFVYNMFFSDSYMLTLTVSTALLTVIVFASVFGTFVPLVLNKFKIDPAIATGPFITTINDITGLFIYLSIARMFFSSL